MNLILYIDQGSSHACENFKNIIVQRFQDQDIQIFESFNGLKSRLRQVANYNTDIFILFADSEMRLKALTRLIDLMEDKRLLMVLPDDSKSIMSTAHQFFPRYFTCINDTYNDLCDVLSKLTGQEKLINETKEGIENGH